MKLTKTLTILVCLVIFLQPLLITNANPCVQIDGIKDEDILWCEWFTDTTYAFKGYRGRCDDSNKLNFNSFYYLEGDFLYIFIQTDDNTSESSNRDHFAIYFDIKPYGLGQEDIAYEIEVPSIVYRGGIVRYGPKWGDIERYDDIASGQSNGMRTFELRIPIQDLKPELGNPIYNELRFVMFLENYGDVWWRREIVDNFHPDNAERNKWWKHPENWEEYIFPQCAENHYITSSGNTGGSINPEGAVSVADGDDQTFIIIPDSGYHILDVTVDDVSVGAVSSYTFTTVEEDHTIEASFVENVPTLHSISASAVLGGSISPNGLIIVSEGSSQLFILTPMAGYHISDVIVDGTSKGSISSYTFVNIESDHIIEAIFSENTPGETVTLNIEPSYVSDPSLSIGDTFWLNVKINNLDVELLGYVLDIEWNPKILHVQDIEWGELFIDSLQLSGPFDNVNGKINQITESTLGQGFLDSSGTLFRLRFEIVGYGDSEISIFSSYLQGVSGEIGYDVYGSDFHMPPPPANPPQAIFSPSDNSWYYYGDLITLDALYSIPGYDTMPVVDICPIQTFTWHIDFGNDNSIDQTIYGEVVDFEVLYIGEISIELDVYAPDPHGPEHTSGWAESDTETHIINVAERPTGTNLDIYTQRGGEHLSNSCSFGPQELVIIYANVTYNDAPVVGKDVLVTIYDNQGKMIGVRTARSNDDGVAMTSFRLPWPDENPENLFGQWKIICSVDIAQTTNTDILYFEFGYILDIIDIDVNPEQVIRGSDQTGVSINVRSIACENIDAILAVTIEDELLVPVCDRYSWQTFIYGGITTTHFNGMNIPNWAYVVVGTVYVSILSTDPLNYGVPYCPRDEAIIIISLY